MSAPTAGPSPQRCGAVILTRVQALTGRRSLAVPKARKPNLTSITEAQGIPDNILLEGNLIHGMQTKDAVNAHTGGLLIWNANGMTMRNNVFKNNAIYDVLVDGTAANWVIENNFFGWPVQPLGNGVGAVETPKDWREFGSKDAVVHRNWLIRYNSFAHGLAVGRNSLNNVRVIGNILGSYSNCTRGAFFDSNVTSRSTSVRRKREAARALPVRELCKGRFPPPPGISLPVSSRSSDSRIRTDFDGDLRQTPRSAGADERKASR